MTQLFVNNFSATVAQTFGAADTYLYLNNVAGLPAITAGNHLLLTVFRRVGVQESDHEVVKVTAITGNMLTVVREVEGAAATLFNIGDPVEARVTAASLGAKADSADVATLVGNETLTNKRVSAFYVLDRTATVPAAVGALTLDVSTASVFNLALAGEVTGITIANAPILSGEALSFVVKVTQGATAYPLSWFSGITWLTIGSVAPAAPAANKTIEYIFTSTAAGTYFGRKGAAT